MWHFPRFLDDHFFPPLTVQMVSGYSTRVFFVSLFFFHLDSGESHKLVSAAVRCVWPAWRHSKVKRATRAEFWKMAVLLFSMWTLWAYFFPCNEAAMWFLFWSRIPLPHILMEETSVFWLLRENSAKKVSEGFRWVSKLGKLCECGATFRSTKTRFSLDKKHEKTCSFAPK